MHNVRTTHVRRRVAQAGGSRIGIAALCAAAAVVWLGQPSRVGSAPGGPSADDVDRLRRELAPAGVVARAAARVERWRVAVPFAVRYRVRPNLAALIHDVARAEGLDPELGFRLVRVESRFEPRATSPVGAIGLAQVMLGTARYFEPDITRERLYDPRTNLTIGFRHLRSLVRQHRGDLRLALLTYNRGPVAVARSLRRGVDPSNGYDRLVLDGYEGSGLLP